MAICGPTVYSRLALREVKSRTHTQLPLKHPTVQAGVIQWMMFEHACANYFKAIFIPIWRPVERFPYIKYYREFTVAKLGCDCRAYLNMNTPYKISGE